MSKREIEAILQGQVDDYTRCSLPDHPSFRAGAPCVSHDDHDGHDGDGAVNATDSRLCVECEDQAAAYACRDCGDAFCAVCYASQHRRGKRRRHHREPLTDDPALLMTHLLGAAPDAAAGADVAAGATTDSAASSAPSRVSPAPAAVAGADADLSDPVVDMAAAAARIATNPTSGQALAAVMERAKWIPVRLTLEERKRLRLLEAALHVSEYTDRVDVLSYTSKSKRIVAQIRELCSIISGLVLAADYKAGQSLFQDKEFHQSAEFYQTLFELGRRHKIMNPEKMRAHYGKLVYLLQDSQSREVQGMLGFSMMKPLVTVYARFEAGQCLKILQDPLILTATSEIVAPPGKPRRQIDAEIRAKEAAIKHLVRKYAPVAQISPSEIEQCLHSIGDNASFLRCHRDPCRQMLDYLAAHFDAHHIESPAFSLAIAAGRGGARLSHNHERQFYYVKQSLTLWSAILEDMFRLWTLAEQDLLDTRYPYHLRDTGQGLNRVQPCPRVERAMRTLLATTQHQLDHWVGSSVIHLGDTNVPNALFFINKYTQIHQILLPITQTLQTIAAAPLLTPGVENAEQTLAQAVAAFGGPELAQKRILTDFFRHAFDGSGADNSFDAGSCIDGRLTSAWNWCSQIEKKSYFPLFLLAGFTGFDGEVA